MWSSLIIDALGLVEKWKSYTKWARHYMQYTVAITELERAVVADGESGTQDTEY
jgi:hypothetical protein